MQRRIFMRMCLILCAVMLCFASSAAAQVNTATLTGTIRDPQGLGVKGATITLENSADGAQRIAETDESGRYNIVGLPPGSYRVTVEGGAGFGKYENPSLVLTVGENATLDPQLSLSGVSQTVTVSSETADIEPTKTEVSQTIEQRRINNLPINGRNYINFTLTNSQATRDVSPTIGPAPNSGINIDGARARSNMVSVDGADAVDNSVNGIRSTVSQEAVQEFQLSSVITTPSTAAPPAESSTSSPRVAATMFTGTLSASCATKPSRPATHFPARLIPLPARSIQ